MLALGFELSRDGALYVLNVNGDPGEGSGSGTGDEAVDFKFPALDAIGEQFLLRRKADLELSRSSTRSSRSTTCAPAPAPSARARTARTPCARVAPHR